MNFSFTEEQQALVAVLRELLAHHCCAHHVRLATEAGTEVAGLRESLAAVGLFELRAPEADGGMGLGVLEVALALRELGYAGAPGAWTERLLGDEPPAAAGAQRSLRLAVGAAAVLCGLSARMLDMAVSHVQVREQFGKPVGAFQAVGHHLADARLALEFAEPLLWRAAWSLDNATPDVAVEVWAAKHHANEAALLCARKSLQCHGAMGYAHEHDLQLFMKQVWRLVPLHGDAATCRRHIASALDL